MENKKTIILSGINLYTGGTLKVMRECIDAVTNATGSRYRIVALVHDRKLYPDDPKVEYISYPKSRKSWLFRLYYEYYGFRKLSRELQPEYWISMHDTTPNVQAEKRIVYCHNPFPFYRPDWKAFLQQWPILFFSLFSGWIYRFHLKKNDWVIVQQEWIREAFEKQFHAERVIVALPNTGNPGKEIAETGRETRKTKKQGAPTVFFFPTGAMIHKNLEALCRATELLGEKRKAGDYEVVITINGTENRYARRIRRKYGQVKGLRFAGYLSRPEMEKAYEECDCLVFPSEVETWGLPVTEAKERGIPVLAANRPWAKETVGEYGKACFFDPGDSAELCGLMNGVIEETIRWEETRPISYRQPFAGNWDELMDILFA